MKLDKLLLDVEHLGFVVAHDPPGLISRPDGFRTKTRQAWAAALREHKPGNRRIMSAIKLAEAESQRMADIERQLNEAYARGRRRAMEPAPEYVSRIPGAVPEKRMVTRGFMTVRNGLKQEEWDAIPVKSS